MVPFNLLLKFSNFLSSFYFNFLSKEVLVVFSFATFASNKDSFPFRVLILSSFFSSSICNLFIFHDSHNSNQIHRAFSSQTKIALHNWKDFLIKLLLYLAYRFKLLLYLRKVHLSISATLSLNFFNKFLSKVYISFQFSINISKFTCIIIIKPVWKLKKFIC